ncbi:hypothetical protein HK405_010222, partial [Cladochytrium tenue]
FVELSKESQTLQAKLDKETMARKRLEATLRKQLVLDSREVAAPVESVDGLVDLIERDYAAAIAFAAASASPRI